MHIKIPTPMPTHHMHTHDKHMSVTCPSHAHTCASHAHHMPTLTHHVRTNAPHARACPTHAHPCRPHTHLYSQAPLTVSPPPPPPHTHTTLCSAGAGEGAECQGAIALERLAGLRLQVRLGGGGEGARENRRHDLCQ